MRVSALVSLLVLLTVVKITAQQDPSSSFSAAEVSPTTLVMSSFTPGLASTNAPVPMATGGAKTPSSSGGGGGGAVAGGVVAALVILGALVLVAVLCLYIRKTKGIFIFKGKSSSKDVISSACPCFALASKGRSDDAYEPVQMGQSENTEPQVDITTSIKTHYEPMDMNMCSVTSSLQTHPYEPTDMNTSSIAIPSNQSHPYEPTDMNTSSIVTSSLHNPYEPVDVNASIVSVSVNPYEPVEVGKLLDNDTSTRMNAPPEPRYSKTPDVSGGVRDKVNEGFTNKLALVTPERKGTDARPDEDQATRAALYGSYDVPRPLDPYDIPRGSSVSHPPPPGELYDTPRTSQYDKPRTSVSVHPPKEVDPSDAKVDVSHTYDIPS